MDDEAVDLTIAKVSAAAGIITSCNGNNWEGAQGEVVEAAAKYLKELFGK